MNDDTPRHTRHSSTLAQGLTAEQAAHLTSLMTLRSAAAGEVLALEGEADAQLYEVVQGTLSIVKHYGTPDETVLATLKAGDLAHELGFLDGTPRYAALVAASEASVLMLSRAALESLIDSQPRVLYRVMCHIVAKVHAVQTRLSMQAQELTNYVVKQHGRY